MNYLPFALLIFSILFCHYNALTDHCASYEVKDIKECLSKDSQLKHFSCCGLKKIYKSGRTDAVCQAVGNTKSSRDNFKSSQEIARKGFDFTIETECPTNIDEIKGSCQEFKDVNIDN